MKRAGILTLGFVLAASTLALAVGPLPIPECVRVEGVITAIDGDAQQIVLDTGAVVQATPATVIRMKRDLLTFDDLAVGQTVRACGLMEGDVLIANRITIRYGGE